MENLTLMPQLLNRHFYHSFQCPLQPPRPALDTNNQQQGPRGSVIRTGAQLPLLHTIKRREYGSGNLLLCAAGGHQAARPDQACLRL
jgi:hypothetical protein